MAKEQVAPARDEALAKRRLGMLAEKISGLHVNGGIHMYKKTKPEGLDHGSSHAHQTASLPCHILVNKL